MIGCGGGNNGGDGFVLARHLHLRGHAVRLVLCSDPGHLRGDAAHNFRIVEKAGISKTVLSRDASPAELADCLGGADWLVDALLGTERGGPRPPIDRLIAALNAHPARKLAVDLPSGLDCDSGQPATPTVCADHTCTFVATKRGFLAAAARPISGRCTSPISDARRLLEQVQGWDT